MKLGLGTVQFGLDYGISNSKGRCSIKQIQRILKLASNNSIFVIDTAAQYGSSEEVIGEILQLTHQFGIVTKTPKFLGNITDRHALLLEERFYRSLENTKQNYLYGLLIHDVEDVLRDSEGLLFAKMQELKQRGLVRKIGVSVYYEDQINQIIGRYPIDIIQLPINVLDQRLLAGSSLRRLKEEGVEIHARSVFLQGALLMNPDDLPQHFDSVRSLLKDYHKFLGKNNLSLIEGALTFIMQQKQIDYLIIGVTSEKELKDIFEAIEAISKRRLDIDYTCFACLDERILNPSLWDLGNRGL